MVLSTGFPSIKRPLVYLPAKLNTLQSCTLETLFGYLPCLKICNSAAYDHDSSLRSPVSYQVLPKPAIPHPHETSHEENARASYVYLPGRPANSGRI